MANFRRLLPTPTEKVLAYCLEHYASQVLACSSAEDAAAVYNRALQIPQSSTRLVIKQQSGIVLNGDFLPNVPTKAKLMFGFRHCRVPVLIKLCRSQQAAHHEMKAFHALPGFARNHLFGPMEALSLEVGGHMQWLLKCSKHFTEPTWHPLFGISCVRQSRGLVQA